MRVAWDEIVKVASAVGGFFLGLFGPWDVSLGVLISCMAADYLSGIVVAALGKSKKSEGGGLDSNIGLKGLLKKGLILLVILVAAQLDNVLGADAAIRAAACWFYIANEALSVVENLALAGVPFPDKIKDALEQMKDKKE